MKLENFLWCFELEFGGIIIGFYHLVIYCVSSIAALAGLIFSIIHNDEAYSLKAGIICIVIMVLSSLMACISWNFIMGIENKDTRKIQIFRIICFFGLLINVLIAIACISQIGNFNVKPYNTTIFIVFLMISFIAQIYILIVVDSIYKKNRDEHIPVYIITPNV